MNRIEELTQTVNARMSELDGIKGKVKAENRSPNDAEMERTDIVLKEVIILRKELDLEKREAELRADISRGPGDRFLKPQVDPDDPLIKRFGEAVPPKEKRFSSIGEQAVAFLQARHGGTHDPRLGWMEEQLRVAGLSEGIPADGGALVQTDFSTALLDKVYELNPILPRISKLTLTSNANSIELPMVNETSRVSSIWGGIIMYWLGEGTEKTKSQPAFKKITLKLKKVAGLAYETDELVQDASVLSTILEKGFTEGLDKELERVIIRGSGAGQPQGILESGALISVAKEDEQEADTIEAANIVKMYARMHSRGKKNAIWLISGSIFPQMIFLTMPGIPTIPLYMPPNGLAGAPFGTLLGKPVFEIENCSKLGDKGDIIFFDPSQYAMIDKGSPQKATSPHVRFIYDENTFRIVYRVDGQCVWASALTPADSSDTVSPIVTLDERA